MPYTIGWRSPASARLKARYELGGWQDNSTYRDPLRDANGIPALLSGQEYATRHGRSVRSPASSSSSPVMVPAAA